MALNRSLKPTDLVQLRVLVTLVGTIGIETVLAQEDIPESASDLVTTLTSLEVNWSSRRSQYT
jgi:hypothetical protein